jgi:hypothetical protein
MAVQPFQTWTPGTQNLLQNQSLDKIGCSLLWYVMQRKQSQSKLILVHPTTRLGISSWTSCRLGHDDLNSLYLFKYYHVLLWNASIKKNLERKLSSHTWSTRSTVHAASAEYFRAKNLYSKISKVRNLLRDHHKQLKLPHKMCKPMPQFEDKRI